MKNWKKRIIALALTGSLAFSLPHAVSAYENVAAWAVEEVAAMEELGLIPETMYDVNMADEITRMDMCRIAVASYEKLTDEELEIPAVDPFTDCDEVEAAKAYNLGLIQGDGNGQFRPDDALTRAEFFTFVGRFLSLSGVRPNQSGYSDLSQFSDAETLPRWAKDHTRLAVGMEIVKGTGSALEWESTTSCQEALVMYYRTYNVCLNYDPASAFTDLSNWAKDAVLRMDELGLIPEAVRENPMTDTITRGDVCRIAMRSYKRLTGVTDEQLGVPEVNPFNDTEDPEILNAHRLGIISGKGNGTFCPNDPITRQDFFKISANFLEAVDYWYVGDVCADLSAFHDAEQISGYAYDATQLLVGLGLVKGDTAGYLHPTDEIISQEALLIFMRIYDFYVDWWENPVEPEPYLGQLVAQTAMEYLGCDYVYGGKGPNSFDCSGFVYYIYKQYGYTIYPGARNQWKTVDNFVERDKLLPGDLVFFSDNGTFDGIYHVGLYIGNDEFIHASTYGVGVIISSLNKGNYPNRYYGAQRPIGAPNLTNALPDQPLYELEAEVYDITE